MMHSHAQSVGQCVSSLSLPGFAEAGLKTRAPWRVRKNSTREEVHFQPWTKAAKRELYQEACRFEEQTKRIGRHGRPVGSGVLGKRGLALLHTLIFNFLDCKTGRCDPSRETIAGAKKMRCCVRTVDNTLARLRKAGVLLWDPRCDQIMRDGQSELNQRSSAYHPQPSSRWLGYRKPPEAPRPEPGTWGDHPSMPSVLEQVEIERKDGFTLKQRVQTLRSDPSNTVAMALGKLGDTMAARQAAGIEAGPELAAAAVPPPQPLRPDQALASSGAAAATRQAAGMEARIATWKAEIRELERNPNDTWAMNRARQKRQVLAGVEA